VRISTGVLSRSEPGLSFSPTARALVHSRRIASVLKVNLQ
jgi:hypothetical protein